MQHAFEAIDNAPETDDDRYVDEDGNFLANEDAVSDVDDDLVKEHHESLLGCREARNLMKEVVLLVDSVLLFSDKLTSRGKGESLCCVARVDEDRKVLDDLPTLMAAARRQRTLRISSVMVHRVRMSVSSAVRLNIWHGLSNEGKWFFKSKEAKRLNKCGWTVYSAVVGACENTTPRCGRSVSACELDERRHGLSASSSQSGCRGRRKPKLADRVAFRLVHESLISEGVSCNSGQASLHQNPLQSSLVAAASSSPKHPSKSFSLSSLRSGVLPLN